MKIKSIFLATMCFFYCFGQEKTNDLVQVRLSPPITDYCFYNIKKAITDFEGNNITYFLFQVSNDKIHIRSHSYFEKLLDKYKINTEYLLWKDEYQKSKNILTKDQNCYEETMNFLILDKYGKNFIKHLYRKADSLYIIENNEKIFDYYDFDTIVRYSKSKTYENQNEDIKKDIKKYIKYPKVYINKEKINKSYSSISFIINKTGQIDIESITTVMNSDENKKFTSYFEEQIINFVKKSRWNPIVIYGISLSSRMSIYFSYD
jgi:hypothetical protein